MDPDATLATLRAIAGRHLDDDLDQIHDMVSAFVDLDQWLTSGGFLPAAWCGDRPQEPEPDRPHLEDVPF